MPVSDSSCVKHFLYHYYNLEISDVKLCFSQELPSPSELKTFQKKCSNFFRYFAEILNDLKINFPI